MATRNRKAKTKNPMQTAFTRFMLIVAFFVLWIGAIGTRLVHLQVNQHDTLRDKALGQRRQSVKEKQPRGTIYDRSERALAITLKVKSLYADPTEITDIDATSREVAKALKLKPQEISSKLNEARAKNSRFVVLAPKLNDETVKSVNAAFENFDPRKADHPRMPGLHWQDEQRRSYPFDSLAAHVLGFSNADDLGSAGIEQSQEENLRGAVIKGWRDRDRLGRVYDRSEDEEREPPKDVVLTLSHSIQYKVEKALAQGVKNAGAKSGMAAVMIPQTGEILALANYPTFDPNRYNEYSPELFTNRAVHDVYSPGSVFKLITYGAAINEGIINPDGQVDCTQGSITVAGRKFNDPHATKWMSYDEAMAVSSNVAAIRTGIATGRENFYGYAKKFGFGNPTGVELPAEANGILRSPKSWNGDSLASMSIGYEIGVSALQMATAYATIANDGVRVQPRIIKEIRQDGKVLSSTEAQKSQVVTPDTARYLKRMLREVVLKGTGRRAQINGYSAAGKTGTAWKYDEKLKRVNEKKYVSSFAGMAPYDSPSVVIVVVMDEPTSAARDGGQVAAPVFRDIAEQILPELGIEPNAAAQPDSANAEEIPSELDPKTARRTQTKTAKPDKAVKDAEKSAKQEKPAEPKPAPKKENATPAKDKNRKGKTARLDEKELIFEHRGLNGSSVRRLNAAFADHEFVAPIFEYRAVAANAERPGVKT